MSIKFEVNMTRKSLFQFLCFHMYTKFAGIMGLCLGIVVFVIGIRQVIIGGFSSSLVYFGFAIFFLLLMPYMLWMGAGKQMASNPLFQKPVPYEMNEEGISLLTEEPQSITWDKIRKCIVNQFFVALYMGQNQAMIFPRESFKEYNTEVLDLLSRHIKPSKEAKPKKEENSVDEVEDGDTRDV